MSNFPLLRFHPFDLNGEPYAGAKMYFYEAGTVTPLAVYDERALSTPLSNPLVADSNGRFERFFMDPSEQYKVKLTDSDDVQIWEEDDVDPLPLSQDDILARIQNAGNSPLDYGAVGDGVADEASYVQDAIDNASQVVDLCGKTYRCDSTINLASGIILKNGTLDFSNCTSDDFVRSLGSAAAAAELNADVTAGDTDIYPTSMSGIAAGQMYLLFSNATWTDTAYKKGELVDVSSVESTYFVATKGIEDGYATADTADLVKITPDDDIVLRNVTILHSAPAYSGRSIRFQYCRRVVVENCTFSGIEDAGIRVDCCDDVEINNCFFEDGFDAATVAVQIRDCSRNVRVRNCRVSDVAKGIEYGTHASIDGVCRDILIENCQLSECSVAGQVVGTVAQNVTVVNCDADNQNAAIDVTSLNVGPTGEANQAIAIQGRGAQGQDVASRYGGIGGKFVGGDAGGSASTVAGPGVVAVGGNEGASGDGGPGVDAIGGGAAPGVEANADIGPAIQVKSNSSTVSAERIDAQAAPTGAGLVGDRYTDTQGRVRTCRAAGTPGTFRGIGALQTRQVLTGSGTYTTPVGTMAILVTCYGGGAGGGGCNAGGAPNYMCGGGGGSGGRSQKLILSPAGSYSYACGAAGAGGVASGGGASGSDGGDTSFDTTTVIAKGGKGGIYTSSWAAGNPTLFCYTGGVNNSGGAGDIVSYGHPGSWAFLGTGGYYSGHGASSEVGGGGNSRNTSGDGNDAVGYASGGGGAASLNEAANRDGGDGTEGVIIVDEYY